jgi:nicotinamidase/pyrazinamidase
VARKALLVIDMLEDFILEGGALDIGATGRRIVPFVRKQIDRAQAEGTTVIYICDRHRPDDAEFAMFPPHCLAGSSGAAIISELAPGPGAHIIPKRRYSGFFGTDLSVTLQELGITDLSLVGVCTNICILYTAADARMRHYQVTVWRDGVASFDTAAHGFALEEMRRTLGVTVV